MKTNIDIKIEQTLNSLDGLQKASPRPFFYTRLQAHMQNEPNSFWASIVSFITRPAIAFSGVGLIVLLNVGAFFVQNNTAATDAITSQNDQAYADDYNTTLVANSYYNENQIAANEQLKK